MEMLSHQHCFWETSNQNQLNPMEMLSHQHCFWETSNRIQLMERTRWNQTALTMRHQTTCQRACNCYKHSCLHHHTTWVDFQETCRLACKRSTWRNVEHIMHCRSAI
ncbi:uncharacterized protein LOC125947770 [Dermacentor silvarum]|uniref:uncharacterized protein LOC125947770 n=1 Tax=Dermacentor silvarum TaxID=543639 RepID=UPI002101739B|nr:uncharacterized protein LOC125947770 [Dermacentor silvarum]